MEFEIDPRLAADCHRLGRLPLCELLLMNDAQYPWCILVPRRPQIREIYELAAADQAHLLAESVALGRAMRMAFGGDKLNVAALGNLVPQLHLHHIVRRVGDPAWPAPVWGKLPPRPYKDAEARDFAERLVQVMPADFDAAYQLPR
jgi:diadenosine tetraphosphate (Ap4A) HIT family hydrolase